MAKLRILRQVILYHQAVEFKLSANIDCFSTDSSPKYFSWGWRKDRMNRFLWLHLYKNNREECEAYCVKQEKQTDDKPLLTSSCVKLWTGPFREIFSTRPLLLSCSFPVGGSLVRTYRSFRLSESTSEAFRFCSVILDDDPETNRAFKCLYLPLIADFWHLSSPLSPAGSCRPLLTVIRGPSLLRTSMVNSRRPVYV